MSIYDCLWDDLGTARGGLNGRAGGAKVATLCKPQARRALATSRVVQVHAIARYAIPRLCPREMPPSAHQSVPACLQQLVAHGG
jgi:hypothetical protein